MIFFFWKFLKNKLKITWTNEVVTDVKLNFAFFCKTKFSLYRRKVNRMNKKEAWVFKNLLTLT